MCDKSCWEDHPRDAIDNSIRELGVIADILQGSAIDSGVLTDVHPGDLGILLSGLRDRLTAASMALDARRVAAGLAPLPPSSGPAG